VVGHRSKKARQQINEETAPDMRNWSTKVAEEKRIGTPSIFQRISQHREAIPIQFRRRLDSLCVGGLSEPNDGWC
jgi:hypothetical protein